MVQIVPGDRTGPDNLAEIVNPIRHTVMAAWPDAQVDCNSIAPEDGVRVYIRRACVTHHIAGIVYSSGRGREKSDRNRQLLDPGRVVGVRDVILPNGRLVRKIVQTGNDARIINRLGLTWAEVCHLAITPKEPVNSRADSAIANHVSQIV